MDQNVIKRLDLIKDQVEDIWIQAASIKDSIRVFEYNREMTVHENPEGLSAIMHIYVILSELQEQKMKKLLVDLELLLAELKCNATSS